MKSTKHFLIFTIAFMLFTVIGTLSHEYGHIIVAKNFGYKTYLHYGSMNFEYEKNENYLKLENFYNKNKEGILDGTINYPPNNLKQESDKLKLNGFWITLGGPIQTMLTGILGLFLLFLRRGKRKHKGFQFIDWLAIFLSLFWLREVFNFVTGMVSGLFFNGHFFGGDEANISEMLNLPRGIISIILGVLGLLISTYIVFKVIPKNTRLVFIISGFVGGLSGFYIWYQILGPKLLP